ncbi:MAG: LysR family transcriptional regulator [Rhodoferax sp.]|nr:LysR family transcriptional regulator [Rhodoferax sp.]
MGTSATVLLNRLLARGKFRHVQVLLRLAELGSVQRTASAIGLTQSSVTQTLGYLERLLDLRLFERHARGVRPTAACRQLLPAMRQLMAGLAQGADVASGGQLRSLQQVRVLASVSAAHGLLLPVLHRFHVQHPQVRVLLGEAEGEDQLLAVTRGEVDLVACRRPPVLPAGWTFEPLMDDELVVLCGPQHPLARRRRPLRWDTLGGRRWLQGPVGSIARMRLDALTAGLAAPIDPFPMVTRLPAVLSDTLRQHVVLALLPRSYLRHQVDAGELVALPLAERLPVDPLGLMLPVEGRSDACEWLAACLRSAGG